MYQDKMNNTSDLHFNFIKIANVGREFDPLVDTINASVKPHKKVAHLSYGFPSPTTFRSVRRAFYLHPRNSLPFLQGTRAGMRVKETADQKVK
jgi:hypothetical protein